MGRNGEDGNGELKEEKGEGAGGAAVWGHWPARSSTAWRWWGKGVGGRGVATAERQSGGKPTHELDLPAPRIPAFSPHPPLCRTRLAVPRLPLTVITHAPSSTRVPRSTQAPRPAPHTPLLLNTPTLLSGPRLSQDDPFSCRRYLAHSSMSDYFLSHHRSHTLLSPCALRSTPASAAQLTWPPGASCPQTHILHPADRQFCPLAPCSFRWTPRSAARCPCPPGAGTSPPTCESRGCSLWRCTVRRTRWRSCRWVCAKGMCIRGESVH